jgi:hypothetical protein
MSAAMETCSRCGPTCTDGIGDGAEHLKTSEAAALLRISPKTLRNKKSLGIFQEGVHYVSPRGLGTRYLRSALERWMHGAEEPASPRPIPRSRTRGGTKVDVSLLDAVPLGR